MRHMSRSYPGNYKAHENRGFLGACANSSHQALLPAPAPEESLGTRLPDHMHVIEKAAKYSLSVSIYWGKYCGHCLKKQKIGEESCLPD